MTKTVNEVRSAFLDFFEKNDHTVLPSSALVPHNDPTLMFTNAGMNQFKNVIIGAEKLTDSEGNEITRAVTSQKCVRAGGKHNDLENVGYTARHHTFFEMLGNFSFGDYFKEEAISLAWDFLTNTLELPKDKLYVTIYHTDDDAYDLWKKIAGLDDDRIIRIDNNDNFWSMGETGPCGPCSEIFYDHGDKVEGGLPGTPEQEGDRYVEIWNLVFMQYEQISPDERIDLDNPCIDTGFGLERVAAILQGKTNNYETDLFRAIINAAEEIVSNEANSGKQLQNDNLSSYRVIADHLRASSFLLADGVMPSNEGRGYVLRRIMRRGMRHAHLLGCKEPLMYKLVSTLINEMGQTYSELTRAEALITETLKSEEERFKETLGKGLKLLEGESEGLGKGDTLSGDVAFKLYDTFGFPLDLTEDILRAKCINVDIAGFDAAMEEQKKRARAAWSGSGESATEEVWFDIKEKHGATEFLGYSMIEASANIVAIVKDGKPVDEAKTDDEVSIVTNQTPFYGESGGQTGDHGVIRAAGLKIEVTDTKKYLGELFVHVGKVVDGRIKVGDEVTLLVDDARRLAIRANHSVTHILHAALRKYLGEHVTQKGSLVERDYFRFDFSNPKGVEKEILDKIENEVNEIIRQNTEVSTKIMTPDEAVEQGAMALFGEKYGEEVRVVTMGEEGNKHYSVELCGGTHVRRTGDIGLFKITSESSIASGVRRVEGVSGEGALKYIKGQQKQLMQAAEAIKTSPDELVERITSLSENNKKLERELSDAKKKLAMGGGGSQAAEEKPEKVGDINFVGKTLEGVSPKDLRGIVDDYKKQIGSGVIALVANNDGKASIVVGVTDDLTETTSAVDLVRTGSEALGGNGGGGRPDFAQAGGPDPSKASEALDAIKAQMAG